MFDSTAKEQQTTHRGHPADETLADFMLAAAHEAPAEPAVVEYVDGAERIISFGQLLSRTKQFASEIDRLGLDIGDRVLLESDVSANSIALCLACASLGLVFIPASPEIPDGRLQAIISTAEPALLLQSDESHRDSPPTDVGIGRFGEYGLQIKRPPKMRVRYRSTLVLSDAAYIIFTSGTTGRPKGVVMSHRAVVSFYRGMLHYGFVGAGDRLASTSPLQFDFSLLDIGLALGSGAAVVPVPRKLLPWPSRLLKVLRDTQVEHVNGVPSIWRSVLRHRPRELSELTGLKSILYCGEPFPAPELRQLQELLPQLRIINCYGATESMACSFAEVPRPLPIELDQPPIGLAHPGAEIMLLDSSGHPIVENGIVGEIYLRSPALFTGYWDDPDATNAALVPDPMNPRSGQTVLRSGDLAKRGGSGELYLCGRMDDQVKIRGNRVELGEIERRVMEYGGISVAVALLVAQATGDPRLVVVVEPAAGYGDLSPSDLASFCRINLPTYMIPSQVQVVGAIPITTNGKADRVAVNRWLEESGDSP